MAVLDAKNTLKNLKKKGFLEAINKSEDHKWLEFWIEDRLIAQTKISHGASDLGDFLIKAMSRQCYLSKEQFMDLAKCPLSQDEYLKILKEKGFFS